MLQTSNHLRIAHLSDPHFSHVTYSPTQFLSKRWLGNFNLLFFRKRAYKTEHLWHLPELIHDLKVESVFVTGDFTSTSQTQEFAEGRRFVEAFREKQLPTFALPGNHDYYTAEAMRSNRYGHYFPSPPVEVSYLGKGWWYIGLNCAVPTPLFCSYGRFNEETQHALELALANIPSSDRILIGNHFPLFPTGHPHHDLKRAKELQNLLKAYPQVKIYLHGHDHKPYIIDRCEEGYPLVLNAGSCAHRPDGSFYIIDLFDTECLVQRLLFRKEKGSFSWAIDWQKKYELKS